MSIDDLRGLLASRLFEAGPKLIDDIGDCLDGQDQPGCNLLLMGFRLVGNSHDDAGASACNAYPANSGHVHVGYGYALDKRSTLKRSHDFAPDLKFTPPSEIQSAVAGGDNLSHARSGINRDGTFWPITDGGTVCAGCIQFRTALDRHLVGYNRPHSHANGLGGGRSFPLLLSRVARERAARRISLCTGRAA